MALSVTVHKLEPVLFPGDTFRCIIEVKNTLAASGDAEYDIQRIEPVAWVSAQIYGQYIADPTFMKLPESTSQRHIAGSTLPKLGTRRASLAYVVHPLVAYNMDSNRYRSSDENGRIMYSSSAEILLCDLRLKPQESRSCALVLSVPVFCIVHAPSRL